MPSRPTGERGRRLLRSSVWSRGKSFAVSSTPFSPKRRGSVERRVRTRVARRESRRVVTLVLAELAVSGPDADPEALQPLMKRRPRATVDKGATPPFNARSRPGARPLPTRVHPGAAVEAVVSELAAEEVVSASAKQPVGALAAEEPIGATGTAQRVRSA